MANILVPKKGLIYFVFFFFYYYYYFFLSADCLMFWTDGTFCSFQGHVENIANLKQQYMNSTKAANEVTIVIEAYGTLRDKEDVHCFSGFKRSR